MRKITWTVILGLTISGFVAAGRAEDASTQEMRSLDEQVQEIKSDVLGIAASSSRLEEKLLYPSSTQVAVFVSLSARRHVSPRRRADSDRRELATHHIYSFKELEALQNGGVQRIYTGNVATGEHQLDVASLASSRAAADFSETATFAFSKGVEPKLLGMTLAGPTPATPRYSSETGKPWRAQLWCGSIGAAGNRLLGRRSLGDDRSEGSVFRRGALLRPSGSLLRGA